MTKKVVSRRRNYYIKKRFQGLFIIKVVLALLLGLCLSMAVLLFFAGNTITADYSGGMVSIKSTSDALLPYLMMADALAALLVIAVGVLITLLFTHQVAGPLYRFEKSLGIIKGGDLAHRVHIRTGDHLEEMKEELNLLAESLDHRIGAVKDLFNEFSSLLESYKDKDDKDKEEAFKELESNMEELLKHINKFKTTEPPRN